MTTDARVSALEDLLARIRRNSQAPRSPAGGSLRVGGAQVEVPAGDALLSVHLDLQAELDDPFGDPLAHSERGPTDAGRHNRPDSTTPPPQSSGALESLSLQRRGTPQHGTPRGGSPRPPTPTPGPLAPSDASPLHEAVISHTATSPRSSRIENGFGLVPPPPRNPRGLPDFMDEPTATGDPDEAENLLLAEQEEAVRAQGVRFPTPPMGRAPTPPPPAPFTLREPPRAPGRPVLELDDLDLSSVESVPSAREREPTSPFGPDPAGELEREIAVQAADAESHVHIELDGAKTDPPPTSAAAMESVAEMASVAATAAAEEASYEEPVFDAPSFATRSSAPPSSVAPPPMDRSSDAASVDLASQDAAPKLVSFDVPAVDAPAFDAPAFDAPAFDAPAFDAPTFDAPAFDAPTFDAPAFDTPPTAMVPSYDSPTVDSPEPPPSNVDDERRMGGEPSPEILGSSEAPSTSPPAREAEEASPSSSRQRREEVRPVDDRFDGFGPVGDSEPPESGEVPSQRYDSGESPEEREEASAASAQGSAVEGVPPVSQRAPQSHLPSFENPSTEDDARSGVVVARISSAPNQLGEETDERVEDPTPRPRRPTTIPPVSNPFAGTPPKPARVGKTPIEEQIAITESASRAGARSEMGEDATMELSAVGPVDVAQRAPMGGSGPVAIASGTRPEHESFGAILDAALALGH